MGVTDRPPAFGLAFLQDHDLDHSPHRHTSLISSRLTCYQTGTMTQQQDRVPVRVVSARSSESEESARD